ncbi:sensor histidine kinase KdpD [Paucisalibacillus sp. EB02]|uniref:sensor histidine kinase n=1 Tax=Paucisalibacillus sp. EB02 TaxID=1347087 RepID=UPI0005A60E54|nr:HAMP domain-containing sensor histidine kinase [Paucisalibacillus sp. EB02]
MWGWIFFLLSLALFFYIFFIKQEIRKIQREVKELPTRSSYGNRLSLDFREKTLLDLIDELNRLVDTFEEKHRLAKNMEENVKLTIAGLSHDLRTPLTSIHGYVQLLHATTDDKKQTDYLMIIEHAVKRLLEMTDQFYDLAQVETNQKQLTFVSMSLANLVEDIFLSFYAQLLEKNIEVHFPEEVSQSQVITDKVMLTRVLQNIVQNILRYAKSEVVISYQSEGDYLKLSVKNDIMAESEIAVEKVFMRFYTEVTSRTNTEASGLGLYLSKKLVEKMNGKLKAELKGKWFIIHMYLPMNRIQSLSWKKE